MNKKFLKIYESAMTRMNRGGFEVSDIVKFKDNALKHSFYKNQSDEIKKAIEDLINDGCALRVKNVINNHPAVMGAGNSDNTGLGVQIEVCREYAPGRFEDSGVLVDPGMLTIDKVYPNLTTVPDKFKRKEKINIKPEEVKDEEGEEVPFYSPKLNTRRSDVDGKMVAGDRSLSNTNVVIPSVPAVGQADPASYTANYLPKA
jgi:hypothetical protein